MRTQKDAHAFNGDAASQEALRHRHRDKQLQGPETGVEAKGTRTLLDDLGELGGSVGRKGAGGGVRTSRAASQRRRAVLVECRNSPQRGRIIAAELVGDLAGAQSALAGTQNLGTPEGERIRGLQAGIDSRLFLLGDGSDKMWWFHTPEYTISMHLPLDYTLGKLGDLLLFKPSLYLDH